MAILKITPAEGKQLRVQELLVGRFSNHVYGFTAHVDGTITIRATMGGILTDVEADLTREGLLVQSSPST